MSTMRQAVKTGDSKPPHWLYVGLAFLAIGLIVNPWVVAVLMADGGIVASDLLLGSAIWTLDALFLLVGLALIKFRHTELPKKILLALFSVIVILVILEVLLRVVPLFVPLDRPDFKRAGILYQFERSTQYHPRWGWSFLPSVDSVWEEDWKGREREPMRTHFQTLPIPGYPDYGMRDDGLNANAHIVMPVFGDSFTFGSTVERNEIWAELIERRNPGIDMLNLASGGGLTKAVEQYQVLRDLLPVHDIVIYQMWLGNEFLDNYVFPQGVERFRELAKEHASRRQRLRLQASSRLAYIVIEAIYNIRKALTPQQDAFAYAPERGQLWNDEYGIFHMHPANPILLQYAEPEYLDERIATGVQNTDEAMIRMKLLVEDRSLVILLFPFKEQLYDEFVRAQRPELEPAKPNSVVLEMCRRHEILCFDLLPMLQQFRGEKLFWDYDPHFTASGQLHAAYEIEGFLLDSGLIPVR